MSFNPMGFVENLKYMGIGMLGVFIIVGIIILATYVTAKCTNESEQCKDNNEK